jgi:superfamily II DNA/RNA helicase
VAVAPPTKKPHKKKLRTREEVEDWDWKKGNIHRDILRGLKEMGITTPTPIQVAVLRPALGGRCILAAAQTGSGKTLAFGVPILHRIMLDIARSGDAKDQRLLFCLVLTPTRELALQIHEHLKKAGRYTPILTLPIVGGLSEQKQLRLLLKSRPHIMVATPGRLSKLLTEESIPFLQQSLSLQLRYLVYLFNWVEAGFLNRTLSSRLKPIPYTVGGFGLRMKSGVSLLPFFVFPFLFGGLYLGDLG